MSHLFTSSFRDVPTLELTGFGDFSYYGVSELLIVELVEYAVNQFVATGE